MKRIVIVLAAAATLMACGTEDKHDIKIDELNAENQAQSDGERLALALTNKENSHEEFVAVKGQIEAYQDAYRTRFGGQAYINFMTTTINTISEELSL